jgi:serine/threonine protein kinase
LGNKKQFGKYRLIEKLTTGGMAEVYRAIATGPEGFSRVVVIKQILPAYAESREFLRMFIDEATIAARLNHANIAQIFDFDIVDGTPYIAMEFVEGKDLRNLLGACAEQNVEIPFPIAVFIALEVAKGLYYVHGRRESSRPLNIIHRDVSPQNIMLSVAGEIKLVDFGIARATERQAQTRVGAIKGKYGYMSPEQVMGEPLDHRTDIFSLGIVLWEMLTRRRLFAGANEAATINNVLKKRIVPPHELKPEIPEALSPLVMRALDRDRGRRYPTMIAFYEALSRYLFETGSYPDVEQIASFGHELFPEEMDHFAQGEHLSIPTDPDLEPEPEQDSTQPARPQSVPPQTVPPKTADRAHDTKPGAVLGTSSSGRRRRWLPALLMGLLLLVIAGFFTYQAVTKVTKNRTNTQVALQRAAHQIPPATADDRRALRVSQPLKRPEPTTSSEPDIRTITPDSVAPDSTNQKDARPIESTAKAANPQPPNTVSFVIQTTPADARIRISDKPFEAGTISLESTPDEPVTIHISKGGYASIEDRFIPLSGMERHYELKQPAHLELWIEPTDAIVKINGKELNQSGKPGHYVHATGIGEEIDLAVNRWGYTPTTRRVAIVDKKVKETVVLKPRVAGINSSNRPSYGFVKVQAKPYADVFFGPQKDNWGVTPIEKRKLPVGEYDIFLRHPLADDDVVCHVVIKEGYTRACFHDFSK